jgi:hypothetical protein
MVLGNTLLPCTTSPITCNKSCRYYAVVPTNIRLILLFSHEHLSLLTTTANDANTSLRITCSRWPFNSRNVCYTTSHNRRWFHTEFNLIARWQRLPADHNINVEIAEVCGNFTATWAKFDQHRRNSLQFLSLGFICPLWACSVLFLLNLAQKNSWGIDPSHPHQNTSHPHHATFATCFSTARIKISTIIHQMSVDLLLLSPHPFWLPLPLRPLLFFIYHYPCLFVALTCCPKFWMLRGFSGILGLSDNSDCNFCGTLQPWHPDLASRTEWSMYGIRG